MTYELIAYNPEGFMDGLVGKAARRMRGCFLRDEMIEVKIVEDIDDIVREVGKGYDISWAFDC
ncbi:hypothetical protein ACFL0X_01440 [Nanoarchaeota archaeon]